MNVMMAAGGYPWTIIPSTDRGKHMSALERASTNEDIAAFADFLAILPPMDLLETVCHR
jgi:hypothetical protein